MILHHASPSTASPGATSSHTYAEPNIYTVILTVTDDGDATDSDTQDVPVGVSPTSMFVSSIDVTGKVAGPNLSATAVVTIRDGDGNPVEGATVCGKWSGD